MAMADQTDIGEANDVKDLAIDVEKVAEIAENFTG